MPQLHRLTPCLRLRHAIGCPMKVGRYFIYDYYSVPRYILAYAVAWASWPTCRQSGISENSEYKPRGFWATQLNRKWNLFSFNIPWRQQNCIAKSFALKETIYLKTFQAKPPPNNAKSSLPVDVRRSETSFVKLPNIRNLAELLKSFRVISN